MNTDLSLLLCTDTACAPCLPDVCGVCHPTSLCFVQDNFHSQTCSAPRSGVWMTLNTAQDPSVPHQSQQPVVRGAAEKGWRCHSVTRGQQLSCDSHMEMMNPPLMTIKMCLWGGSKALLSQWKQIPTRRPKTTAKNAAQGAHARALCYLPKQEIRGIVGPR